MPAENHSLRARDADHDELRPPMRAKAVLVEQDMLGAARVSARA